MLEAQKVTICRYGEIFLKGKNQIVFFRRLVRNIRAFCELNNISYDDVRRDGGRIIIFGNHIPEAADVCGLVSVSPGYRTRSVTNLEQLKETFLQIAKEGGIEQCATMRVKTKRTNKKYPYQSQEVNEKVAGIILDRFEKKVDLKKPDFEFCIDIIEDMFYISTKTFPGVGGLPVEPASKVISLISGGIDSPVSSFLMNKRGCMNTYVHFSSRPHTSKLSEEKVMKIVKHLTGFQLKSKLYIVQLANIQKYLSTSVHPSLLVIFYRRMMLRIADEIRRKEHAFALVTGDNMGQVASQTLLNMTVIQDAVHTPVFRPLLTFDKSETMALARRIGTYDLSMVPFDDCCTLFVPKYPETEANVDNIRRIEESIFDKKLKGMLDEAIETAEIFNF